MELTNAIMTRRSIRKFTDEKVPDEMIVEILQAARFAPSWANTQVWEFIIIRDSELIKTVTETYGETNPARKCSASASVLIAVCAKTDVSGCKDGVKRTQYDEWFMFDAGLAVQNLCLRAHELGLGTVVVGSMNHQKCAELLDVPAGYALLAVIPVGYPVDRDKPAPARKELSTFVHLDKFGKPWQK